MFSLSYFSVKRKKVKMFHIDDTPSGVDELTQESSEFKSSSFQKVNYLKRCSKQIICIHIIFRKLKIGSLV